MLKSCDILIFYIFTTDGDRVRPMVAEITPRLGRNSSFTIVVSSLLIVAYCFFRLRLRHLISTIKDLLLTDIRLLQGTRDVRSRVFLSPTSVLIQEVGIHILVRVLFATQL